MISSKKDTKYVNVATNVGSWYEYSFFSSSIVGIIPLFVKALKIILSKRFVIIKQSQTFKRKYDDEQFKWKTISSLGC